MFLVLIFGAFLGAAGSVMFAWALDAARDAWERGEFAGMRARVRAAVRLRVVLPVVWAVRSVRRRVAFAVRVRMVDVRRRWGFLRGASVLTAVCVPVWMTRYQVWERLGYGLMRGGFVLTGARVMRVGH